MVNFIYLKSAITAEQKQTYSDSIIFCEADNSIYTHGQQFGISPEYIGKINDLETALEALEDSLSTVESEVAEKVAGVVAANGIEITGPDTEPIVGLKINTESPGNVTLTADEDGLKANVTIPNVPVQGVDSDDKVLSLVDTKLTTTLGLTYSDNKIKLVGKDNVEIGSIDTDDFIVDGMLNNVELDENDNLVFTFNTDSGKTPISIDLSKYIDAYDGSNLKLKNIAIPSKYEQPASNDSVDSAVSNLIAGYNQLNTQLTWLEMD